ncbi:MAG TPA: DUF1445 domain-containing protein, partial [Candidatus Baltobacteraceae bacterium]|nr:DUF1445 domain-containing protein [Candidatus Baltobacteraceae bacterium]
MIENETGAQARAAIRVGRRGPTAAAAPGYVQANLVALSAEYADEFRSLCARNPVACPLLDELPPGVTATQLAAGADLRVDVPAYRLYRDGELKARSTDGRELWRDDLSVFLIGCSFTFEWALTRARLPPRHVQLGTNVPMYRTNVPLAPAGRLRGHLIVSMRPYLPADLDRVKAVTRPFSEAHGEPFWAGNPHELGIADLSAPDEGDAVPFEPGELPV